MKTTAFLLAFVISAGCAFGQRFKIGEINAEKPEGQLLQNIGQESDAAKKMQLLEKFVAEYPRHEAAGWVYEQMEVAYAKAGQPDKVMEVGEKLIAMDPEHLDAAQAALKAAEEKKDPDLVKKWAITTGDVARKVMASQQPKDEDADAWKKRVEYAKQVNAFAEYTLFATALQTADPAKKIALFETLEQRNPKSEYLPKAYGQQFLAYRQAGANDKAVALAEKVLATDQSDEDMLLVVADNYLQTKKEPDKIHQYSSKIVEVMNTKQKPQGVADADWDKRKQQFIGLAHYMSGKVYFNQNKFAPADKELHSALPASDSNPVLKAEVLFMLGLANYKMEKIQEAANYNRECAAIKSPFQAQAAKNLAVIKAQYRGVK